MMANDRLYLRCKGCGSMHFVAKTMANGWYGREHFDQDDMLAFMNEHADGVQCSSGFQTWCTPRAGSMFEFVRETEAVALERGGS